jgi:hypothetical protein
MTLHFYERFYDDLDLYVPIIEELDPAISAGFPLLVTFRHVIYVSKQYNSVDQGHYMQG